MHETDQATLLITLASFFDSHDIPYMITGAWSVIFYGRPRASHDIDFVVEISPKDTEHVLAALDTLPRQYAVQKEGVREGIRNKNLFQIIYTPLLLKIDVWLLTNEPFDQTRFRRRTKASILGRKTAIASAEDTILQKLRWYKGVKIEKHLIDAAFVYQTQRKRLDKNYLNAWAKKLAVTGYLKQLGSIDLEPHW
ncbi:hypothetical protein HY339_01030 [Candidatus Gottesmanbacteria bacterium]|nr:hypothetical protein [Candidatus Gottesmanbacteria bacterium]